MVFALIFCSIRHCRNNCGEPCSAGLRGLTSAGLRGLTSQAHNAKRTLQLWIKTLRTLRHSHPDLGHRRKAGTVHDYGAESRLRQKSRTNADSLGCSMKVGWFILLNQDAWHLQSRQAIHTA